MLSAIAVVVLCLFLSTRANLILNTSDKALIETTLQDLIQDVNQQTLTKKDRLAIITNAALVLEQFSPHRFMHLNYFKVDPAKSLRDLEPKLDSMSNFDFHRTVSGIFDSIDDAQTFYKAAYPLYGSYAYLGFTLRHYYPAGQKIPAYVISEKNLTVIEFDGVPVHEKVLQIGESGYRSSAAAKEVRGRYAITVRSLWVDEIPQKANATLLVNDGISTFELSVPWAILTSTSFAPSRGGPASRQAKSLPKLFTSFSDQHHHTGELHKAYRLLRISGPSVVHQSDPIINTIQIPDDATSFYEANEIITSSATYGYINIKEFTPFPPPTFQGDLISFIDYALEQLSKTLQNMPFKSVVIDVSENFGGLIYTAKQVFELLTDKSVPAFPIVSRASKLTLSMYSSHSNENDELFLPAVKQYYELGEPFTGPIAYLFNYSDSSNGLVAVPRAKQAYRGKLIILTNGDTYSASELFAAWVQDTDSGLIIGLDETTGGGGATSVTFTDLQQKYPKSFPLKMPTDIEFGSADNRFFRSGNRIGGTLFEKFAIRPTERYYITFRDAFEGRKDLFNYLGKQAQKLM